MKIHSTSLIIKKAQIKSNVRKYMAIRLTRIAKNKNEEKDREGEGEENEKKGTHQS